MIVDLTGVKVLVKSVIPGQTVLEIYDFLTSLRTTTTQADGPYDKRTKRLFVTAAADIDDSIKRKRIRWRLR